MPTSSSRKPMLYAAGGPPSVGWPNAPTSGPRPRGRRRPLREGTVGEVGAHFAHEMQVEVEVVQRRQLGAEHLARHHQVPEGTAAEPPTPVAGAVVLDRPRIA